MTFSSSAAVCGADRDLPEMGACLQGVPEENGLSVGTFRRHWHFKSTCPVHVHLGVRACSLQNFTLEVRPGTAWNVAHYEVSLRPFLAHQPS